MSSYPKSFSSGRAVSVVGTAHPMWAFFRMEAISHSGPLLLQAFFSSGTQFVLFWRCLGISNGLSFLQLYTHFLWDLADTPE